MFDSLTSVWQTFWDIPHIRTYFGLAWAGYIIFLGGWIVLQKREPVATISWLLGLVLLPYIGLLVYYLFGPHKIHRQRRRRARARSSPAPGGRGDGDPHATSMERLIERTCGLPPATATRIDLLVDGGQTYEALLTAIAEARHHVHAEYYIFAADHSGDSVRDALTAAARRGVKVRLLLDAVGSGLNMPSRYFDELLAAGGELEWFHRMHFFRFWRKPWFNLRSHRKIVVVDGRIGFTGGINITDSQDDRSSDMAYRDLHLRLEGEVVNSLTRVFADDWAYACAGRGNACEAKELQWTELPQGEVKVQVVASGPDSDWEAIHRVWVSAIHDASRRLWLVTPYFVPGEAALMALTSAALSGIDVRLMVPRRSDSLLVTLAARSYFIELLRAGVRVFEYAPRMLHSKAMLADDGLAIVGSANFDHRSFRLNFEAGCCIRDPAFCERLQAVICDDFLLATELDLQRHSKRPLRHRLPEAFARLLSPLL